GQSPIRGPSRRQRCSNLRLDGVDIDIIDSGLRWPKGLLLQRPINLRRRRLLRIGPPFPALRPRLSCRIAYSWYDQTYLGRYLRVREDTVWIVALWHGDQIPDEPEDE